MRVLRPVGDRALLLVKARTPETAQPCSQPWRMPQDAASRHRLAEPETATCGNRCRALTSAACNATHRRRAADLESRHSPALRQPWVGARAPLLCFTPRTASSPKPLRGVKQSKGAAKGCAHPATGRASPDPPAPGSPRPLPPSLAPETGMKLPDVERPARAGAVPLAVRWAHREAPSRAGSNTGPRRAVTGRSYTCASEWIQLCFCTRGAGLPPGTPVVPDQPW